MPELPEVETVARDLRRSLVGKVITRVTVTKPKMLNLPVQRFSKLVKDKKIRRVVRRAKIILFYLSGDYIMAAHLKMTGQLIMRAKGKSYGGGHVLPAVEEVPNKFTRAAVYFKDKSVLYFNDLRQFGWLRLFKEKDLSLLVEGLGVEPLSKAFTMKYWLSVLSCYPKRTVKRMLLDQSKLAGLGNIYADEAAHASRVRPTRRLKTLTAKEQIALYRNIKKILQKAIKARGTTFNNYRDAFGKPGSFVSQLRVYGRAGQVCRRCRRGVITKIRHAGRGTHYCVVCQA